MTGYTSGKVVTHDPQPWELYLHNLDMTLRYAYQPDDIWESCETLTYAPRPQKDNHNPILVEFREFHGVAEDWLEYLLSANSEDGWTRSHIDHARRVLTKLAALRGE